MREINKIILHCSATPEGKDYSVETIRQWHLDRGLSDIGYHYVIQRDGTIDKGRPEERQGAHVRGHNRNSIGISYIGGVESKQVDGKWIPKDTRTEDQVCALEYLIEALMNKYPDATLHGHNEFSAKACPSFDVKEQYKHFIKK